MPRYRYVPPKRKHRIIAPRLTSGDPRESLGHGLPPDIKAGIQAIAASEGQSVSWVLEQVLIDYFGLARPDYVRKVQRVSFRNAGLRLPLVS